MPFVEASQVLLAAGLSNPILPFLSPDPAFVRIYMFQPTGIVEASPQRVGPKNVQEMAVRIVQFLMRARDAVVDLALCPEYACPWSALMQSIDSGYVPPVGSLWILGCESATRDNIDELRGRLPANATLIVNEKIFGQAGAFVDFACYLFQTTELVGQPTLVLLLQPKTHPMGGDHFEYTHLKSGVGPIRFRNTEGNSNSLVGLICSDSLHPDFANLHDELHRRTLIVHLQLNPNPSSENYSAYRRFCCMRAPRTSEILWLNWAKNTRLEHNGEVTPMISEPKTMLFRDAEGLATDDGLVAHNHALGCYLSFWESVRSAAFIFSPDECVFHFETTKPYVEGPATNALRTGPRMLDLLTWDETNSQWASQSHADDRFKSYWHDSNPELKNLLDSNPVLQNLRGPLLASLLESERLIQLCVGYALERGWANWRQLRSYRLADDDTARRLPLCWSTQGVGVSHRQECLGKFKGFLASITNPEQFSPRLSIFKDGKFHIEYKNHPLTKEFRNLHHESGVAATAIHLGYAPAKEVLDETKARTLKGLRDTESDTELTAIWFIDHHRNLRDYMDSDVPKIDADPGVNPVGFTSIL